MNEREERRWEAEKIIKDWVFVWLCLDDFHFFLRSFYPTFASWPIPFCGWNIAQLRGRPRELCSCCALFFVSAAHFMKYSRLFSRLARTDSIFPGIAFSVFCFMCCLSSTITQLSYVIWSTLTFIPKPYHVLWQFTVHESSRTIKMEAEGRRA